MQKESNLLFTLAVFANLLGFGVTPLLAQAPKNEPAGKAGEAANPAAESSENAPQAPVIAPQAEWPLREMGDYSKAAKAY